MEKETKCEYKWEYVPDTNSFIKKCITCNEIIRYLSDKETSEVILLGKDREQLLKLKKSILYKRKKKNLRYQLNANMQSYSYINYRDGKTL